MNERYLTERHITPLIEVQAKQARQLEYLTTRTAGRMSNGARVYNSANISITNITLTALTFDTERYDTAAFHSTSVNTSRLTVPAAGRYFVHGQFVFTGNPTGTRTALIRLNGTTYLAAQTMPAIGTSDVYVPVSTVWEFAASDYVELIAYQDCGSTLNVNTVAGGRSPEFMIERLA